MEIDSGVKAAPSLAPAAPRASRKNLIDQTLLDRAFYEAKLMMVTSTHLSRGKAASIASDHTLGKAHPLYHRMYRTVCMRLARDAAPQSAGITKAGRKSNDGVAVRCPVCGGSSSSVFDTLSHAGSVFRHRRCKRCKTSFPTREMLIDTPFWPAATEEDVGRIGFIGPARISPL